jgi:signal transduction histidine kinase
MPPMKYESAHVLFRHRSLVLAIISFAASSVAVLVVALLARLDVETRDANRFQMHVSFAEGVLKDAVGRYSDLLTPEAPLVQLATARMDEHHPSLATFLLRTDYYPGLAGMAVYEDSQGSPDTARPRWSYGNLSAWPSGEEGKEWLETARSASSSPHGLRARLVSSAQCRAALQCDLLIFRPLRGTPPARTGSNAAAVPGANAWLLVSVLVDPLVNRVLPSPPGETEPRIRLNLYSVKGQSRNLAYSNIPSNRLLPPARFRRVRDLPFAGSNLQFEFTSTPAFDATTDWSTLNAIGWGGSLGTLSIAAFVFILASRRQEALKLAEQMRQASLRSEADARDLIEIANHSRDVFVILDGDGRIRWLNGTAVRLSGMERGELIGRTIPDDPTTPQLARDVWRHALAALKRGESHRFQWRGSSAPETPSYWDIEFQSILGPDRQVESVLVFGRELSAGEVSRQMLIRVQQAVDCLNDAVYITGPNREALYSNRAFASLLATLGVASHEALCLRDHLDDPERANSILRDFEASGFWSGELTYTAIDGSSVHLLVSSYRIEDDRRQILGAVTTFRDISARKEMEEDLRQARDGALLASRHKSSFLANMSHEIRTPMNGVLGMLRLMRETSLDIEQREYTDLAHRSAETLLALLNDILDFSKIEAGQMRVELIACSPVTIFKEVCTLMGATALAKELAFEATVDENMPATMVTDPTRLRQILHNLLSNAIKFTESGSVGASCYRRHSDVYFEVADTGIGVDPKQLPHLFQPFTQGDTSMTRRFGGTGLGLAICKELVELLGGEIGLSRREGGGSIFWFTIPLSSAASEPESSHTEATLT